MRTETRWVQLCRAQARGQAGPHRPSVLRGSASPATLGSDSGRRTGRCRRGAPALRAGSLVLGPGTTALGLFAEKCRQPYLCDGIYVQLDTPLRPWVPEGCPCPAPPLEDLTWDSGAQGASGRGLRHLGKSRKLRKVATPSRPACLRLLVCTCSACACWDSASGRGGPTGTRPPGPCSLLGLGVPGRRAGFVLVSSAWGAGRCCPRRGRQTC